MRTRGEPFYRSGGVENADHKMIVRRAALAIAFELYLSQASGDNRVVDGAFTWVATGLDGESARRDVTYLDLERDLDWAVDALKTRVFEPDFGSGPDLRDKILASGESGIIGHAPDGTWAFKDLDP